MPAEIASELIKTAIGLFFDVIDILISILPSAPFRVMLSQLENSSGMDAVSYTHLTLPTILLV